MTHEKTTSETVPFSISRKLTVPNCAALFVSLAFVSGYLIHSIFVRTIGITNLPLLKAEYIETGIVFIILSVALIFTPLSLWYIITGTKDHLGFTRAGSKRSLITLLNFTMVLLFFALFVTGDQWGKAALPGQTIPVSFRFLFHSYLAVMFVGILAVGHLQRFYRSLSSEGGLIASHTSSATRQRMDLHVENLLGLMRWILLALTVCFDVILCCQMPWIRDLLDEMRYYVMMLVLSTYMLYSAKRRIARLRDNEKLRGRLIALTSLFAVVLFYLVVIAYSYGAYPHIPSNRGGRLAVAHAVLVLEKDSRDTYNDLVAGPSGAADRTVPLRVLEETEDGFYVARPDQELSKTTVIWVKREHVSRVEYLQIDSRR